MLPVTHRGSDGDMEFLAEDLTGDITRELAQHNYFKVIAARRMAAWRGKAVDYRRRLGGSSMRAIWSMASSSAPAIPFG